MQEELLEKFVGHLRAQDRSERTTRGYLEDVRGFASWFEQTNGEDFSPTSVTPLDVREYKQHLYAVRRLKPATVNRRLVALKVFFAWAVREGLVASNPAVNIEMVKQVKSPPRWLDRKEQFAFLREVRKEVQLAEVKAGSNRHHPALRRARRDEAMVALMLHAGLRVEEVCKLRLKDVELNARSGKVTVRGKGGKVRRVPLNAEVRKALQAWLEVRPDVDHDSVFVGQGGTPLTVRGVQKRVALYARRAGLEDCTPHVLRHTFAKNLVDLGVSLDRVAALLGHESLNTTAVYTRPSEADLQKAVDLLA